MTLLQKVEAKLTSTGFTKIDDRFWEKQERRSHTLVALSKNKVVITYREYPLKEGWWQNSYSLQEFLDK